MWNVILVGDLNFTLSSHEIWGTLVHMDPMSEFFNIFLISKGLMDVEPVIISPIWSNGRRGDDGVSKRLDRFLFSNSLVVVSF